MIDRALLFESSLKRAFKEITTTNNDIQELQTLM